MSMMDRLDDPAMWQNFLEHKIAQNNLSHRELEDMVSYIEKKEYLPVVERIHSGEELPLAEKCLISKMGSEKKRTIYFYPREFNYVLKLLTWLLYDYDGVFSGNLWSFRRGRTVRQAVKYLLSRKNISQLYSYKMDIHDYFNSADVSLLLEKLEIVFEKDPSLLNFCRQLLTEERVLYQGHVLREQKGMMAGVPLSSFFANVYLAEMDRYFWEKRILYARYSDDVIVFDESLSGIEEHIEAIGSFIEEAKLTFNPNKVERTVPGEIWTFLGVSYRDGQVEVSEVSVRKIKGKLRRKAKALERWKKRKGAADERAARAYIRYFNKKFYENPVHNELTWCRWYFPLITAVDHLREIDHYMQQCIRYVTTGKHTKAAYNLRYETMQNWGYRPLVAEFYKMKKADLEKEASE